MENNYFLLTGFENILLEDSYVLDISENANIISFVMEFAILEKHSKYKEPLVGEKYCYLKGSIIFNNAKYINWNKKDIRTYRDANNEIDYANIDIFNFHNGKSHLIGDWGDVEVSSDTPFILLPE